MPMEKWQAALRLVGLAWYIGICIGGGILGGLWLDGRLNTKPLFVIVGLLLGLTLAMYGLYRMIKPLLYKNNSGKGS
jgi:ATP synthase protein I